MNTEQVWYETRASQGLILHFVIKRLHCGYSVTAISCQVLSRNDADALTGTERFLPIGVKLNNPANINESLYWIKNFRRHQRSRARRFYRRKKESRSPCELSGRSATLLLFLYGLFTAKN